MQSQSHPAKEQHRAGWQNELYQNKKKVQAPRARAYRVFSVFCFCILYLYLGLPDGYHPAATGSHLTTT